MKAKPRNRRSGEQLKKFDLASQCRLAIAHYRSAIKYLQKDPIDIAATGGTNWQKYLPPISK